MTAYAAGSSQGTCTESSTAGSCSLGNVSGGAPATVALVVSDAKPGTATLTGTATNAPGRSSTRTEKTTISAPAGTKPSGPAAKGTKPSATTDKASKLGKRTASGSYELPIIAITGKATSKERARCIAAARLRVRCQSNCTIIDWKAI
jgi:hypothetical protein